MIGRRRKKTQKKVKRLSFMNQTRLKLRIGYWKVSRLPTRLRRTERDRRWSIGWKRSHGWTKVRKRHMTHR